MTPEIYEALRQELTAEFFAGRARPPRRQGRGPQKAPTKEVIALRVNREALAKYRATGRGWQTRLAATIERAAARLERR